MEDSYLEIDFSGVFKGCSNLAIVASLRLLSPQLTLFSVFEKEL